MKIRTYQPSDCKSLADLFYHLADATEVDKQVLQKQYHIAKRPMWAINSGTIVGVWRRKGHNYGRLYVDK